MGSSTSRPERGCDPVWIGSQGGMSSQVMEQAMKSMNLAPFLGSYTTLFQGVFDMNTTADQPFSMPANVTFGRYVPLLVVATQASTPILLATGGIYTAPAKGGVALVAGTQVWTGLTGPAKVVKPPLTVAGQDLITGNQLYFSLGTPMGAPGNAYVSVMGLPGAA